jgi:hypothetical protein
MKKRSKIRSFKSWKKGPGPRSAELGRTWGPQSMGGGNTEKAQRKVKVGKKILISQKIQKPAKSAIPQQHIQLQQQGEGLNSYKSLRLLHFFIKTLFSFHVQAIKHKAMWQALKPSGSHCT